MPQTPHLSRILAAALAACALALATGPALAAGTLPAAVDPLVQNLDKSVSPGTDFFSYANGAWLKANPIPASERGWGIANLVYEETYRQRVEICTSAAASGAPKGSSAQKVGDFWATGMDSTAIEAAGAKPLAPWLDGVAAIRDRASLVSTIARFHADGMRPLYGVYVGQDERNSEKYMVHLSQGGIRMPDRGYYLDKDSSTTHVRGEYRKHVAKMFALLGESPVAAKRSADVVVRLETALARRSRTLEERRDPWANYNKMSLAQLVKKYPSSNWKAQFAAMGLSAADSVIVGQPEFLRTADSLLRVTPLAEWKTYLRWNAVNSFASYLSSPFALESFHFYGTVMNGTTVQRPRWKRIIDETEDSIGELLGQEWVKKYCSPATKARYEKLTNDILTTYAERMRSLPWMSEVTKQRALAKLAKVTRKVAYPDQWRDYSTLQFERDSWASNHVRADRWWFAHEAAKLGKPVDRTEWDMTPQTYNAYYDPSKVEIVLPAAMFMIPGVPDSLVDDALLYSYAGGSTIGHEITHGFDDEGRQGDENGNLNAWWLDADSVAFTQRAQKLVDQFNGYTVGDKHVRGQATLGENLADLGGVVLGLEAFKKTDQYRRNVLINGQTPTQRYFLGYALSWLGHRRPQSLAQQIMTDVHAPGFLRVNGPVVNVEDFYTAFGVKPGDAMYRKPEDRVAVW